MFSGSGFPTPARIAYDPTSATSHSFYIDTSSGSSIVCRINMAGLAAPPTFDAPSSNRAVGCFNFPSDAFVICSNNRLVSFSAANSMMEMLVPLDEPGADSVALAHVAQTQKDRARAKACWTVRCAPP